MITAGIFHILILRQFEGFVGTFEGTDSELNTESVPLKFFTNPSKLRIYLCKIPTVITETLIV